MFNDRPKCRRPGSPSLTRGDSRLLRAKAWSLFLYKTDSGRLPEEGPRRPSLDLGHGEAATGKGASLRDFQRLEILEINLWVLHVFFSVLTT